MKKIGLIKFSSLTENAEEHTFDCLFCDNHLDKHFSVSLETLLIDGELLYCVVVIDYNDLDIVYLYNDYKCALRRINNIRKNYLKEVLKNGCKN